jgi:hypothetical protein
VDLGDGKCLQGHGPLVQGQELVKDLQIGAVVLDGIKTLAAGFKLLDELLLSGDEVNHEAMLAENKGLDQHSV